MWILRGIGLNAQNAARNIRNYDRYKIRTTNGTYIGKMYGNNMGYLEFDGDDGYVDIQYNDITHIWKDGNSGGKRINYSTKKSKNRRHTSRRRRMTKKHSGTNKRRA